MQMLKSNFCGLTPSKRNSLNRDLFDFCMNVKTFWSLCVTRGKAKYLYVISRLCSKKNYKEPKGSKL